MDKQEFTTSILTNNSFKRVNLNFSEVEQAYEDVLKFYEANPQRLFDRKYWFLGLTLFSYNQEYQNANYEYDLLRRLRWELSGRMYKKCAYNGTAEYVYYTGMSALKRLCEIFESITNEEEHILNNIQQCSKACLKVYEREKILRVVAKYYYDKNNIEDKENVIVDLDHCCDMLEKCVFLLYKYEYTPSDRTLEKVKSFLTETQNVERRALENCVLAIQSK